MSSAKNDNLDPMGALRRLVNIADGDTGQSRLVANFLLAWWNAGSCGGFDLTDLWGMDTAIRRDVLAVMGLVAELQNYPDAYGFGDAFDQLVRLWRPELVKG